MHWRNLSVSRRTLLVAVMGVALVVLGPSLGSAQTLPTLPQLSVDTTMPAITGNTYTVNAGGNFQTNLNQAAAADPNLNHLIVLQAGATFTGPFNLPARASGNGWVVIRSSAISSLPGEGTRVGPANAPNMAKLVSSSPPYLLTSSPNAHHYRFVGIEFTAGAGTFLGSIVNIGMARSLSQLEHHIIFDRVYVHGDPTRGANKGLAASGNHIAVVDSYVTDCKDPGNGDTNAIWVFNSTGPIKIVNNYLAGGGENVMFGGGVPYVTGAIPSDVEIRGNYVVKPASWAGAYAQKNLIEWKHGKRFLIDSNIFENQLVCGQAYGIMLTPRTDTGNWAEVSDITFTNNIVRNACGGLGISGR